MKATKLLALLLAVILCMSVLLGAGAEEAADDTVLATVNGETITLADVEAMYDQVVTYYANSYGYDISGDDMRGEVMAVALNTLIQDKAVASKGAELNLYVLSDEETAEITAAMEQSWEEAVAYYSEAYFGVTDQSTDEEKAEARVNTLAMLESMGYTYDSMLANELEYAKYQKVEEYIMAGVAVTDEEVQAAYEARVAADEANYKDDAATLEYYQYMGYTSYYMPAGYRGVLQILLEVDEELLNTYSDLSSRLGAEAAEDEEPVTQEQVDAAHDAIMAAIQPVYDEIIEKYNAGTPIVDLISEYNIDPGMTIAENLENGYEVHKDSIMYDPQFVAAAFSVDEIGQVSQPYVGSYGAYVVYYLRDIPAGAVALTDSVKETLTEETLAEKQQAAYAETIEKWTAELDVQYTEAAQPYLMTEAE